MTDEDKQQIVEEYNAAMCASNEAGYAGITAAETIRYLIQRAEAAEAEIARRDAAASEPADRIVDDGCGQQIGGVGVSDQLNCVWPIGTKFYTAAPPAVVSDDALREVIRIWQRSDCPSPEVYSQMRDALGAQPAVLPPEMIADETSMMSEHAAYWYNKGRADTAVLCAQPQKPAPDGWKLVPVEPTQRMIDAYNEGMVSGGATRAYRDMLAAAPAPVGEQ